MASKKFPDVVHAFAYNLHTKGYSHADIQLELDEFCRKQYKRSGPSLRTVHQWAVDDNWSAQDEATKAQLIEKSKEDAFDEQKAILDRLTALSNKTYEEYLEQAKEGVRLTRGQALYALIELSRLTHGLLKQSAKGPDVKKIVAGAMGPLFDILQEVLGQAFVQNREKILEMLQAKIVHG